MMKKFLPLLFLFPFLGLAQQAYYNDVDLNLQGMALKEELSDKITTTHTNMLSYTPGVWEASKITDEDPDNSDNVLLLYGYDDNDGNYVSDRTRSKNLNGGNSGTDWNREHTYAKSLGTPSFNNTGPGADAHHLRPSDVQMNSIRGNRMFTDGSGNAGTVGSHFYPGDEWKGDVARMMMYMYLRYGSQTLPTNVAVGTTNGIDPNMVNLLLEWNAEDPVSTVEDQRNAYHDSNATYAQGNRNPFIDNPNLATRIWGGPIAEDRWNSIDDDEAPSTPTNLSASNATSYGFDLSWTASTDNIAVSGYQIFIDGELYTTTSATTNTTINGLDPETTYSIYIIASDASGNLSEASNTVQATTLEGATILISEDFNDCTTYTTNFTVYSQTSDRDWQCIDGNGQNGSGSIEMNAYASGATVPSVDWLITTNAIDFSETEDAMISFYAGASFGNSELELLYSDDYVPGENAENYTWIPVPNVNIPLHSGGNQEEIFIFENEDISAITGTVYFAFRYDTNGGEATRWRVDNFLITDGAVLNVKNHQILDFTVYPNPSMNGIVNIQVPGANNVEYFVYDITGKLILNKKEAISSEKMTINNLSSGFYLVKINSEGKTATKKLIVR